MASRKDLNQAIADKYPRTCFILRGAWCEKCINRGYREGCKFDLLPLTIDGKVCRFFVPWGQGTREVLIERGREMLRSDAAFQKNLFALRRENPEMVNLAELGGVK